jgi:hypothetical protein
VRHDGADELDGARQIRGDQLVDLRVAELFGRADDAVAGIGDHDIDPTELRECPVHHLA